jgi:hypothetical protein
VRYRAAPVRHVEPTLGRPPFGEEDDKRPGKDYRDERGCAREEGHDGVCEERPLVSGGGAQGSRTRIKGSPQPERMAPKTTCSLERMKTNPPAGSS